jgi:hypothetical protein
VNGARIKPAGVLLALLACVALPCAAARPAEADEQDLRIPQLLAPTSGLADFLWLDLGFASREGIAMRLARVVRLEDGMEVPYGFGASTRPFLRHPAAWQRWGTLYRD